MTGRLILSIFIFITIFASGNVSCAGKNIKNDLGSANELIEGWLNDDTYQIGAGGIPVQSLKLIEQRKESARLDAILNARCQIIEKFTGVKIRREALKNNQLDGISIPGELKSIVNEGSVKKTVWDYNENCEIIFEIKFPGLKKKAGEGTWN